MATKDFEFAITEPLHYMFIKPQKVEWSSNDSVTKASDTYTPTQGMKTAAKRALRWKKEGKAAGAGTPIGWGRATDIVAGRNMSLATVKRMYSFFSRHEVDKKGKDFDNISDPSNGRIMWDAWGGDAGFTWSRAIVEREKKKLEKHLLGQHDQKTHGKGGLHASTERESFWGSQGISKVPNDAEVAKWKATVASDIADRMSKQGITDEQFLDYHKKHVFAPTMGAYQEPTKKWEGTKPLSEIVVVRTDEYGRAKFSTLANSVTADLQEVTWEQAADALDNHNLNSPDNPFYLLDAGGQEIINNDVTRSLVGSWAVSSNDESATSLTLQDRARELFGLERSATWDISESISNELKLHAAHTPIYDAFLRSQYDATQEYFKSVGIKEVTLYRGIHLDPKPFVVGSLYESPEQYANGFDTKLTSRPLSSWTTAVMQAEAFALSSEKGQRAYVLKKVFPVEKIISTPFTGVGCLREREMVTLGGEEDVFAIGTAIEASIADKIDDK